MVLGVPIFNFIHFLGDKLLRILMCLKIGTPKSINFLFGILKHIRVRV